MLYVKFVEVFGKQKNVRNTQLPLNHTPEMFSNTMFSSSEQPLQRARISVRINDENSKIQKPIIIVFWQACTQKFLGGTSIPTTNIVHSTEAL